MGFNARINPQSAMTASFASIATNASATNVLFSPEQSGQIIGGRFINGATSSVASGTTAASAMNVYVMKTAIDTAASVVCSERLGQVATLGTATLTMSTSTALTRFTNGAVYLAQVYGGAGNNRNNAGAIVQVDFMYAHSLTTTTP